MNQGSLAKINFLLRRVSQQELAELLSTVLQQSNGQQVRNLLAHFLRARNLFDLINLG
jgi:phosphotransferase system enzyme I (PtsP)